jgi:hypothetical protein
MARRSSLVKGPERDRPGLAPVSSAECRAPASRATFTVRSRRQVPAAAVAARRNISNGRDEHEDRLLLQRAGPHRSSRPPSAPVLVRVVKAPPRGGRRRCRATSSPACRMTLCSSTGLTATVAPRRRAGAVGTDLDQASGELVDLPRPTLATTERQRRAHRGPSTSRAAPPERLGLPCLCSLARRPGPSTGVRGRPPVSAAYALPTGTSEAHPTSRLDGPQTCDFVVAGAGFEPATSGL